MGSEIELNYRVVCTGCGCTHPVAEINVVNVEEDYAGRDVAEFRCPVGNTYEKSVVLLQR